MDTSASEIEFDSKGECGYCRGVRTHIGKTWFPDSSGVAIMKARFEEIRIRGQHEKYDSILGLSGGIDSAVVASRAIEHGLRPLAVHVDGGWNTRESILNVRSLVRGLGLDLKTIVIDWDEMRRLQLAFLRSGELNQDIPQDHAFFVSLYRTAIRENITTILSGVNFATESVEPTSWGRSYLDGDFIQSIMTKFGGGELFRYPLMSQEEYMVLSQQKRFTVFEPLNFGPYNPSKEIDELKSKFNWVVYEQKHAESVFTKWFQSSYLPRKHGIDKRRAHLSSKIIAGITNREESLSLVSESLSSPVQLDRLVAQRLQIETAELTNLIEG
jgi:7-cyano-7-deazaguanine synthase in queuosine biosynthesis